jgi:hypothetical protein
VPVQLGK